MKKHHFFGSIVFCFISSFSLAQNNPDSAVKSTPQAIQKREGEKSAVKVFYIKDDKPLELPKSFPSENNSETEKIIEQKNLKKEKSQQPK